MNREKFLSLYLSNLKEHHDLDYSKADAKSQFEAFLDSIIESVDKHDGVTIVGWGGFKPVHKPASEGRNPQTGEKIKIEARKQVKFTAGSQFKDAINGKAKPKAPKKIKPVAKTSAKKSNKKTKK